jgi:hypothetical protein
MERLGGWFGIHEPLYAAVSNVPAATHLCARA